MAVKINTYRHSTKAVLRKENRVDLINNSPQPIPIKGRRPETPDFLLQPNQRASFDRADWDKFFGDYNVEEVTLSKKVAAESVEVK